MNSGDLLVILPELWIAFMAALILMVGVFRKSSAQAPAYYLSIFTLVAAPFLIGYTAPPVQLQVFNNSFISDNLSVFSKIIMCLLLLSIFIYCKSYITLRNFFQAEFFALCLFSLLGMMVLVSVADFLTMFLAIELLVLPLYAIIVMVRGNAIYAEAALKYFVIGSLGAGLLLYGISLIYGAAGGFAFSDVANLTENTNILYLGVMLVIVGLALEFGAVPFHMWLPDVYQGSPTAVTMVIGTLPKIAIFAIAFRILTLAIPNVTMHWQQILLSLGLLSVVLGNTVAIAQVNIKRMLAYSTIGHIGFILLGLFVAPQQGYVAPLFYVLAYALMALAAFAVIIRLSSLGFEADLISDFRGLNQTNPYLAFLMLLIMFALAGVPPLIGFYAKFLVLQNVIAAGYTWVAIVALLSTVIAAYYYLRIVKVMYFDAAAEPNHVVSAAAMTLPAKTLLFVNSISLLVFGLFPGVVMNFCIAAFK